MNWISLLVGVVGIISTFLAWKLNPRRALYEELDEIYRKLDVAYAQRDEALSKNDSGHLVLAISDITRLFLRKGEILQRIGANPM